MEIDIYKLTDIFTLMEEANLKIMLTIKQLHEITGKDPEECANIVTPFYQAKPEIQAESALKEKFKPKSTLEILYLLLDEIKERNRKLQYIEDTIHEIKESGLYDNNSIAAICEKIDSIQGTGLYNSIADICEKIDSAIDEIQGYVGNKSIARHN